MSLPESTVVVGVRRSDWVHAFLGGGKVADILLWRKEKIVSVPALILCTYLWYYAVVLEIPLIRVLSMSIVLAYGYFFLFTGEILHYRCPLPGEPVPIPQVYLPREPFVEIALAVHRGFYYTLFWMREFAIRCDILAYFRISLFVGFIGAFGGEVSFGTFSYILMMLLFVVPLLLEKTTALYCNICVFATAVWYRGNHKEKRASENVHTSF